MMKNCIEIFLNITNTFDIVDHNILIDKLKSLGIRGTMLKLLKTLLSGRKQSYKMDDNTHNN